MRYKILAVVVAFAGFGVAAVAAGGAAQAAGTTTTAPSKLCPAGTQNIAYCTDFCPKGTLVGAYCEPPHTHVRPPGRPRVFKVVMWGAKQRVARGPALKFHVRRGINFAPFLKKLILRLPPGLTFSLKSHGGISVGDHALRLTRTTMTLDLLEGAPFLYVYIKNHTMIESPHLRHLLEIGKIKRLTFHLTVINVKRRSTNLTFRVVPQA